MMKLVSLDMIPDDIFTKKQMVKLIHRDINLLLKGSRSVTMDKTRAIPIMKTSSRIAEPYQKRLITIKPLAIIIYDKSILSLSMTTFGV